MSLFKPAIIFSVVVVIAIARLHAADVDLARAVDSLVEAERGYAKLGSEKGFRAASLAMFEDNAVIFTPNATNGKKFWTESKEDLFITWRPVFASIARSGDLGYTTGPSEFWNKRGDEKPEGFGHFVSIWRKDAAGTWKVALDVGVIHAQPQQAETETKTYVPKSAAANPESLRAELQTEQNKFSESAKKDEGDAILDAASNDIRVYRRGAVPVVGRSAVKKMFKDEDAKTSRTPGGAGASSANDLAYEYGEYTSERKSGPEHGSYFCIWQLDDDGDWKLVVDLQKSAPPPKQ